MCGICGVVGGDPKRELAHVRAMARALAHRGPDDEGVHAEPGAVLGNRRLEIIDLEGGHQPLANEDRTLWITYNGEVYNFRALRDGLHRAGHRFRTGTDTEVVLHLYEEYGPRCLERLRGMFAFAIWDRRRETLFAARDRFGQKPFFYAVQGSRLIFASEVKAVLAHADVPAEPDPGAIDHYLALRFIPAPLTMLRAVRKLPAGHHLTWRRGEVALQRYWQLAFRRGEPRPDEEWVAELRRRVEESVAVHLVSDVPVGALLSGGIDSSVVVAEMARALPAPFPTFTIGSEVPSFDERPQARRVAASCGTVHRERVVTAAQLGSIPHLVRALDEPSDPIAACFLEAARLTSEHVKVALGGDGGDEIFAGFDRYAAFGRLDAYAALPRWLREGFRTAVQLLSDPFAYKSWAQRVQWLAVVGAERGGRRYARMTSVFRFGPEERAWLYGPALEQRLRDGDPEQVIVRAFEEAPAESPLDRMLHADVVTRLPEHTLMLADRLSMAHGLELRCPLLDHELAEFCASMPQHLKIRRGKTKVAMRRAARGLLPPNVVRRPKQGFMFPVAYWLNAETLPGIRTELSSGPLVRGGWVRLSGMHRLFEEHLRRLADHHVRIWMLLSLDAWLRIYLDGSPSDASAKLPARREPRGAAPRRRG